MKLIKYSIPLLLFTLLVVLAALKMPWLFLILLASSLLFNSRFGIFEETELRQELHRFYANTTVLKIKLASAILLVIYNIYILYLVHTGHLSIANVVFLNVAVGVANGCFLLTLAHDLSHSNSYFKRCISDALAMVVCMPFFRNDHEYGHHELIGTDQDDGSATLNQNCYHFVFKSFSQRLWRSYHFKTDIDKPHNSIVLKENSINTIIQFLIVGLLICISFQVFLSWLLQCFIAIFAYEVINYIQHYGLSRDAEENIELHHSWNSYYKFSNYFLWFLPIHSAHHVETPIYQLNSLIGPKLPYPFFKMFVIALYPKWWFKVMNPLVQQYNK